jgi:hypothetical protein
VYHSSILKNPLDNIWKKCVICSKGITTQTHSVKCTVCKHYLHDKCLPIYLASDLEYAKDESNDWTCPGCLADIFPFNGIETDQSLLEPINNPNNLTIDVDQLNTMVYDPLDLNEDDSEGALSDIDPDQNCLRDIRGSLVQDCKYFYSSDQIDMLQENLNKSEFSVFHLNIRSTPTNFDKLIPTLHTTGTTFDIIALSETWLKPLNADCYGMEGYEHEYLTRNDIPGVGGGGGVNLYYQQVELQNKRRSH